MAASSAACVDVRTDDGVRLVAERHGAVDAPSVLLVHGLGFSRAAWASQVDALTGAGYAAISWDLRGFGDSDPPNGPYGMERLVSDLEAIQDALGLESFHVVAHSMGGMLAQRFALAHPERVRSLVLASSSAHSGRRGSAYAKALADISRLGFERAMDDPRLKMTLDMVLQFLTDPEVRRQLDGRLPAGELPSGERFLAWIRKLTREPNPARAFAWEVTAGFSTRHDLDRIRCPALVMHGSADLIIPYVAGELLHDGLPDSRWRSFPGAGHDLPRERAEGFNEALLGFLAEVAQGESMTAQAKTQSYGPVDVTADEIGAFHTGINYAGGAAAAAHPFFCARVLIPGSAEALFATGVDINRIVHAGIEINFKRMIRAGDALSQVSVPQGVEEKGSGKLVSIGVTIRDGQDEVVVDGVTRYFARGEKRGGKKPKAADAPWVTGEPVFAGSVLTQSNQSLLYAEGSGDRFPIHTDDAFAQMVGLPGVIMHGMCTLALSVNAIVADQLGGDLERLAGVSCRFAKIVLPGEALTVTAARDGEAIRFETENAEGELVISEGVVRPRS